MTGNGENMGRFIAGALDCFSKALQLLPNDSSFTDEFKYRYLVLHEVAMGTEKVLPFSSTLYFQIDFVQ
ncbi:hypothetical protein HBI56_216310 [Parastagonospora nodorum]|nr:hypothetical protein HBH56_176150 [Parastagonospora nodorum]KAH3926435.1 hypothetical protein HBH54_167010 [Parastagonospora nodorum]KAH3939150.1 hypothetical protein HBH53_239910 [Parastagonospora nodorum]KAH3965693.1 hypothetical protein HBH52_203650 [Parastagonospora nodorum]KAH3971423.1 hypothetical protein HBH51_109380 [Parastagonospora nodorum]